MKKILAAVFFVVVSFSPVFSQTIEYGRASELLGVSRIYINTGMEMDLHDKLSREIQKKLPNLVICDKPEDAEVFLVFGANSRTFLAGVMSTTNSSVNGSVRGTASTYWNNTTINGSYSEQATSTTNTTPIYRSIETGNGHVFKRVGQDRFRVMMSFKDTRKTILERKPSTNFAREFIKAYLEANNGKSPAPTAAPTKAVVALTADELNQEGIRLFNQQRLVESESAFREAVRLEPYNALYHYNLGTLLNTQRKYEEAEKEVELASRLAPSEAVYRQSLEVIRANRKP